MIKLKSNIFIIIVLTIIILLVSSINIYFYYQKYSNLTFYNEYRNILFDCKIEINKDKLKVIYIYDQFECEQCIIEHLKLMNSLSDNSNLHQVNIFVSCHDKASYFTFLKYKKVFNLKIDYLKYDNVLLNFKNIELKLPIIILVDENKKIINAWRADIQKLSKTEEILKNKLQLD